MSPFDLNIRHLRGLLQVCEAGSISAAAPRLNISQPALTQGIVKLESLLGHILFERRPDGMIPTEVGSLFFDRVRAFFEHLNAGMKALAINGLQVDRRLNMAQFKAFLAVVQAGSFVAASSAIDLSQPAVHRAVRELEDALKKQLVERRGRGVHVNFLGRRFARSCRLAVAELQSAFIELGIDAHRRTIAIGTTPLARAYLVPEAMATVMAETRSISFHVSEGNWGDLVELLRDGLIDMIVGELPSHESPDLKKIVLCQEQSVVVAGKNHPLARKGAMVGIESLSKYPWIVPPENSPLRDVWSRLFHERERPATPIECGSIMIIGRLLTSSEMLTIATPDQVALQIRTGLLARIPLPFETGSHTIGFTIRDRWRPTVAQQHFLDALTHVAKQVSIRGSDTAGIAKQWNS
ncbi:MAG: LysR family transcriptional regulator [Burkholderiaceae bacterium]|nr:LysR family transcriptional regulator [Burkholderiaceae bacterium]